MSLSKKKKPVQRPPATHPHTPIVITIITPCQCNLSDSTNDNRPTSPHRPKCGALIPNHADTTNDSGDQMATPRYANRKPQGALQGNRTLVQQLQHDHSRCVLSLRMCQDCTGVPNRTVVPFAGEFFNHPGVKDGRIPCSCVTTGRLLRSRSVPSLVLPSSSRLFLLFTFYFTTSTHSTPINLIHPFISIIYLSFGGQLILGTDNSLAVCLSAKSSIPAQSTTTTAIVRELIPHER